MMVKLIYGSGLMGIIIGFTQTILVKYVANTQYLNKESWGCFQSLVKH